MLDEEKVNRSIVVLTSLLEARDLDIRKLVQILAELDKEFTELSGGRKRPETEYYIGVV